VEKPALCPECGSKFLKLFGVGTQKVEEETKKLFPNETIIRMDMDTTTGKHSHAQLLDSFRSGEAKILIGTQMIAKGLDFPNVTLVGIMAADLSLNTGDFRAGETTFQLLTQVSGRAGRADYPGKVFIQTYSPEHYAVIYAQDQNYEEFYKHEIALRRQMSYPPFTHLFAVMFSGPVEDDLTTALKNLAGIMSAYNRKGLYETLGPAPCQISKIKNMYRWKILVKAVDEEKLKNFVLYCLDKLDEMAPPPLDVARHITLDPSFIE
jgi:primosomal protein N' (replication factor Y)